MTPESTQNLPNTTKTTSQNIHKIYIHIYRFGVPNGPQNGAKRSSSDGRELDTKSETILRSIWGAPGPHFGSLLGHPNLIPSRKKLYFRMAIAKILWKIHVFGIPEPFRTHLKCCSIHESSLTYSKRQDSKRQIQSEGVLDKMMYGKFTVQR